MSEKLSQLRERIDQLDEQLQSLLTERAKIAQEVAATKTQSEDNNFYRAEREAQVLRCVKERNQGPFSDEEIARLFREIMSACLALEQVLSVAYLGPEGSFTQDAALKHFGHSIQTQPLTTIADVFREVESGNASYGVVPVENSTEGVVSYTQDQFMSSSLNICGEVELRVHHHLLGKNASTKNARRIYSHRQSLAQCRKWLETNMHGLELLDVNSNSEAARLASTEENALAIASDVAAELYGLNVLVRNIEDEPDNTTRFLVIGRCEAPPSGKDKTSLLVSTQNKPGALYRILEPLVNNKISMTRIESRPSRRGMWNYVFFIDCEGHRGDANLAAALSQLESEASFLKVLGSYPRSVL